MTTQSLNTNSAEVKKQRGQFFTVDSRVHEVMSSLIANVPDYQINGKDSDKMRILEPSAGAGHLVSLVEEKILSGHNSEPGTENEPLNDYHIDAVEFDESLSSVCQSEITYSDFFLFAQGKEDSYDLIIGNPPYVAWKNVENDTYLSAMSVKANYSDKANLYHLFIDRCIDLMKANGEMILIIPKEWLYSTSAGPLREKIYRECSITHFIDCKEEKVFPDASVPSLMIIRVVKKPTKDSNQSDSRNHDYVASDDSEIMSAPLSAVEDDSMNYAGSIDDAMKGNYIDKKILSTGSRWMIIDSDKADNADDYVKLSEVFTVRVGMVSGLDSLFRVDEEKITTHQLESETIKEYITTKGIEKFIDVNGYDSIESIPENTRVFLLNHKEALISRKIKNFTEKNWWEYGAIRNREIMLARDSWISVEARSRKASPFTVQTQSRLFSGGILGLYPLDESMSVETLRAYAAHFNSEDFKDILRGLFLLNGNKMSLQPSTLHDALIPVL